MILTTAHQLLAPNHPTVLRRTVGEVTRGLAAQSIVASFSNGDAGRIVGARLRQGVLEGRRLHGPAAGRWAAILVTDLGPRIVDERGGQVIGSREPRR